MNSVGICLGATNIKIVELETEKSQQDINKLELEDMPININNYVIEQHGGDVRSKFSDLFAEHNLEDKRTYVTGRKFKSALNAKRMPEPEATEIAYKFLSSSYNEVDAIVSAGGETFLVYELNDDGSMANVYTGSKCASGTGEFFQQQIKRMGLDISEAIEEAKEDNPYKVAGRCSVFCKSDCTHALNKGKDKGRVVAGLCEMMADKIMELIYKCQAEKIMLVGGLSKNRVLVSILKERLKEVVVPREAAYFEALGAALKALQEGKKIPAGNLFTAKEASFDIHPPLKEYMDKVTFHNIKRDDPKPGDRCILGLDVGSTTTKAVLLRENDEALLASEYLRTEGDPVGAAKNCYQSIADQIGDCQIEVIGLGVTGSGRRITGLHALTDSIMNEIIAHASGAVYFDSEVDTIFEIGGQDAKYTYLINQVPTNYAMNEACSAGTGSFLEEAAEEFLDVEMLEIADKALQGNTPPNFNDQCSAFIGSDIKTAIQEGLSINDICAGLVYSICLNYTNRVRGNRPMGDKIFMQGGVCYNRAVPMAMAALTGRDIIVPPEPGLMGAFGAALETASKIENNMIEAKKFDLTELAEREVEYLDDFICQGGETDCDRKCQINVLKIKEEKHLFGGICNKYMNFQGDSSVEDIDSLNLVKERKRIVFDEFKASPEPGAKKGTVGLNRSLTVHTLFPLYSHFFAELGYEVVLPDEPSPEGIQQQSAAFCYPIELSHGYMYDLIKNKKPDYVFLPQVKGLYVANSPEEGIICPMAQAEPYYLSATWEELSNEKMLAPVLDFKDGFDEVFDKFMALAEYIGEGRLKAHKAWEKAIKAQQKFHQRLKEKGQEALEKVENHPANRATVIFGRPYNAFATEANLGIPHKFASRGELVIPFDMLPIEREEVFDQMYWSIGQLILKGSKFVSNHPQLFGTYITNFSCGPDAFLLNYFREDNGNKPTLTLELDSHTADVGLNTRIEAFLDIVSRYRKLEITQREEKKAGNYQPAEIVKDKGEIKVITSDKKKFTLDHPRVKVLIPSMGRINSQGVAAAFRYIGVDAEACPPPGEAELKRGRANATGKECLPYILTMGTMLNRVGEKKDEDKVIVYFMAESSGPCRLGQYSVSMRNLIRKKKINNVAVLSLNSNTGYSDLGIEFSRRAWKALVLGEVLTDIYSAVLALAVNPDRALEKFEDSRQKIMAAMADKSWGRVKDLLEVEAEKLSQIELHTPVDEAKKVALTGEIYVRNDQFSRRFLIEKLAEKNIVTTVTPVTEWIYYADYLIQNKPEISKRSFIYNIINRFAGFYKRKVEKDIKNIMAKSGLSDNHLIDVDKIVETGEELLSLDLTGETILTIGGTIAEIVDEVDGVLAIGPFGCMHHRVSESIITDKLEDMKERLAAEDSLGKEAIDNFARLPFLAIESDGNAFPQVIEARLEAFCLQVERINEFKNEGELQELKKDA